MADDKIAVKEEATVLERACEGVGVGGGLVVGVVAGAVGGAIEMVRSRNWDEAKETFGGITGICMREGGKIGRKHMPGMAFGVIFSKLLLIGRGRR